MTDPSPTDTGTLYATNLAGTPGATLRDAREKAGLSIDEMAAKTKIPLPVLQAIEHDDTAKLGQPVYVRGYLRRYAKALDVPETQVMSDFDSRPAARPPMPQPPPPSAPEPEAEAGGAGPLFWLAIIVILAAIAGAGVLYLRGGSFASLMHKPAVVRTAPVQRAPAAPPAVVQPEPAQESTPASEEPAPATAPKVVAPAAGNPEVPGGPPPVERPESGAASPAPTPQAP